MKFHKIPESRTENVAVADPSLGPDFARKERVRITEAATFYFTFFEYILHARRGARSEKMIKR